MEFHSFHLMPYRHALQARAQYESSWMVLPNEHYDPALGSALYEEYISQLVYAADLGFDGILVNEHHQTAYSMMPAPNVIAPILIDRTRGKKTKVGVIGRALPLVNNPLQIAEEFATLDNLSEGRLIVAFVRGIGAEYHSSGVNPIYSHDRFHEAHDLIIQAWTKPGPSVFEGDHYNFRYVNIWPTTVQKPHPPIWIPSQGSSETIEWASRKERRYPFLMTFSPKAAVIRYHNMYKELAEKDGWTATGEKLGWSVPIFVAETDAKAEQLARTHIEALFNDFLYMRQEMLFPPGYTSMASMKAILSMRKGAGIERATFEGMMEKEQIVVGSPSTVIEKLSSVHNATGFEILCCGLHFGTMPDGLVRQNLQMMSEEVIPKLRHLRTAIPGKMSVLA